MTEQDIKQVNHSISVYMMGLLTVPKENVDVEDIDYIIAHSMLSHRGLRLVEDTVIEKDRPIGTLKNVEYDSKGVSLYISFDNPNYMIKYNLKRP